MLADLWGKLYLFHPRIVTTNVDWNRVLVETIPRVEKAGSTDELVAVLNESLFKPLDDPFTSAQKREASVPEPARRELAARKLSATVGYIDATDPRQYGPSADSRLKDLLRGLGPLDALIVDLRFQAALSAHFDWLHLFLDSPQTTGAYVSRVHEGWNENNSSTDEEYHQGWKIHPGMRLKLVADRPSLRIPTVFVVNNASYHGAADVLDILQSTGRAAVMLEQRGRFDPGSRPQRYSENIEVRLNTAMLLSKSGNLGPRPDYATADPIAETELVGLAVRLLEERKSRKLANSHPFPYEMTFPEPEPVSAEPLSRERRLHGLFKMWTVISYMYIHVQYASIDWSTALSEWIPSVEAAENLPQYYTVLRRLAAQLNDSHIGIFQPSPRAGAIMPVELRPIQGKPVVVGTLKGASGEEPPIHVGDEILAVNGKRVEQLFAERQPLISASTPGALLRNLVAGLFAGYRKDEQVEVLVQNESGAHPALLKTITPPPRRPSSPSYKLLDGGFGYINLGELTEEEMQLALGAIAVTKGLILDMRGYPRFDIHELLAPRITDKVVQTTIYEVPVVSTSDKLSKQTIESFQWMDPHPTNRYIHPIVVLIDDRAQSAAEGFCIYLRNAKRATFVGSTTAGTNGDITRMRLPGGASMTFTGMRVKFGDGSRFQNIGIVPDVKSEPTIRGIRAGRDEVLEKGVEVLQSLIGR